MQPIGGRGLALVGMACRDEAPNLQGSDGWGRSGMLGLVELARRFFLFEEHLLLRVEIGAGSRWFPCWGGWIMMLGARYF